MSASLSDVQQFADPKGKGADAILHLIQGDGSLKESTGKIMVATEAGIGFKEKGKSGVELLQLNQIEEIAAAPAKAKSVTQKKLQPIEKGSARQHLLDRHGVELSWAKEATEDAAYEWHSTLDHSNLGHVHVAKDEKKNEDSSES